MPSPSLRQERAAWARGTLLVGVDEAGRGPLAGPVVAAAVIFPAEIRLRKLIRDSKTLSEGDRNLAATFIRAKALAIGVGASSVREIDRYNIRQATIRAMRRAIERVLPSCYRVVPKAHILLDGLAMPELGHDHEALVDGDALCFSVSAAGIIAKTVRDRLMTQLARRHPGYSWETNMGYGTETHRFAINTHGVTRHHRMTFAPVAQLSFL
ncbi:MAG: ribonuclease HII [Gemmatimonadota bacterium]